MSDTQQLLQLLDAYERARRTGEDTTAIEAAIRAIVEAN